MHTKQPDYGLIVEPKDADGVVRARTKGQLRGWIVPKVKISKVIPQELGGPDFPGVYVLLLPAAVKTRAYAGECGSVRQRLSQHAGRPPKEIRDFAECVILSDARPTKQSDLSDPNVRKSIESFLIILFSSDPNYEVVNRVKEPPELSHWQVSTAEQYRDEIAYVLSRIGLVKAAPALKVKEDELSRSEISDVLGKRGHRVKGKLSIRDPFEIDGKTSFMRPGSKKKRGWQITLRNDFRKSARDMEGYLLVNRGCGLLIPFSKLRELVPRVDFDRKTVDVFVRFKPEGAAVWYKEKSVDVSDCALS